MAESISVNDDYRREVERLFDLQRFGMKFGLDNIRRMLKLLDAPRAGKRTVLVGGTNGKGSITAMLAAICRVAGLRTGMFTSPHLVSFTERIQIDGERIGKDDVVKLTQRLWEVLEPYRRTGEPEPTTFFEALTAIATRYFHEQDIDLGIVEVGLGGRLDATNALPRELLVLSDLALDHGDVLGDTLEHVIAEKAALMQPGLLVIASGGMEGAAELLIEHAGKIGAHLQLLDRNFSFAPAGERFDLIAGERHLRDLPRPFIGKHQFRNAATAVRAALALGIDDEQIIRQGLDEALWPGRYETFPGQPSWLLDCAHNPAGAAMLADTITPHAPTIWLTAGMADKDINGILSQIAPKVDAIVCTDMAMARSLPAARLAEMAAQFGKPVSFETDPRKAMEKAGDLAGPDGRVLAAGSIYLVGFVRGILTGEQGP